MRRVLVIEDGTEYTEAFRRLSPGGGAGPAVFDRAGSGAEARRALASAPPSAVFLDVVFDRTPEAELEGDLAALASRFGGDRRRAVRQLSELQGFYLLDTLAPLLPRVPVVLAYDFGAEPARLAALRRRVPTLEGLPDGAGLAAALALLLPPATIPA